MGIHKAGLVAVPLNTRLATAEMLRILGHARPSVLLGGATVLERHPGLTSAVPLTATTGRIHHR